MIEFGLYNVGDHEYIFYGYIDAYWVGSVSERKITLGGCYCLGPTMISWFSRKQYSVSLSMTEAEYITTCYASCEAIWLQKLMSSLFDVDLDTILTLCDNGSRIKMMENPVFHDNSKHIEIWYFCIRDMVQKGAIKIQYVSTDEQVVDVMIKSLSRVKFEYFHDKLGVVRKDIGLERRNSDDDVTEIPRKEE